MSYRAETGTQPVWNEKGSPLLLFYIYYCRTNVNNGSQRPRSLVLTRTRLRFGLDARGHTGPRVLKIDDEGYPVQPYGFESNLLHFRCC